MIDLKVTMIVILEKPLSRTINKKRKMSHYLNMISSAELHRIVGVIRRSRMQHRKHCYL
jgi:hypothetical protein